MLTQFLEKNKKSFTCIGVATNRPIYNLHYYRAKIPFHLMVLGLFCH